MNDPLAFTKALAAAIKRGERFTIRVERGPVNVPAIKSSTSDLVISLRREESDTVTRD